MLTRRMSGVEQYSVNGSAEESRWISSPPAELHGSAGGMWWSTSLGPSAHPAWLRLIPPAYVKPFVKPQKNDATDAEAICEAAQRPSMRFVAVKSEQQQAAGLVFRTRDRLVRQRTQLINAIRGHLTEFGWVAPKLGKPVNVAAH
jgi:transposase